MCPTLGRPRTRWRDISHLAWDRLGVPPDKLGVPSWRRWLGRGKSGLLCLGYHPHDPSPDNQTAKITWESNRVSVHPKSSTLRLHAKQKEGGRGLVRVRTTGQEETTNIHEYRRKFATTDHVLSEYLR